MNPSSQSLAEENRELKERLFRCEQALYQSQDLVRQQKTWLDRIGDEKIYKAAHLLMRIKEDFLGSAYTRADFLRWLRKKSVGQSRSNYIYQLQKLRDQADFVLCAQAGPACTSLDRKELDYYRFKRRHSLCLDFGKTGMHCTPGLVSVVLPVYNGGQLLNAAIESILQQTYPQFELIIVDDGSTDGTPALVDDWARRDSRIRVIHQANQKIPRTLNNGFAHAEGEYLTWTSADNNLHRDFLEKMVGFMAGHPRVALCYANMRLIDETGAPIRQNSWYPAPDDPSVVCLPEALLRLNSHPENLIGAAFMYRRVLPALIGGYDPALYTVEDYDYWLRISDFFNVCHVDFSEPIYEYRLHKNSLTAHAKELHINEMRNRMMYLETFRQRTIAAPLSWALSGEESSQETWRTLAAGNGHRLPSGSPDRSDCVQVEFSPAGDGEAIASVRVTGDPQTVLTLRIGSDAGTAPGELWAADFTTAFRLAEVFARARLIALYQHIPVGPQQKAPDVTIAYCCPPGASLQAMRAQVQRISEQIPARIQYEFLILTPDPTPWAVWAERQKAALLVYKSDFSDLVSVWEFALYHAKGDWVLPLTPSLEPEAVVFRYFTEDFRRDPQCALIAGQTTLSRQDSAGPAFLSGGYTPPGTEYTRLDPEKTVLTGHLVAFRRQALLAVGGFPSHWNGYFFDMAACVVNCLARTLDAAGYAIGCDARAVGCQEPVSCKTSDCTDLLFQWARLLYAVGSGPGSDFHGFADTLLPEFLPACRDAGAQDKVTAYVCSLQADDLSDSQDGREVLLQEVLQ